MSAELWMAGADLETANALARKLAAHGIAMVRQNPDGTLTWIGAKDPSYRALSDN